MKGYDFMSLGNRKIGQVVPNSLAVTYTKEPLRAGNSYFIYCPAWMANIKFDGVAKKWPKKLDHTRFANGEKYAIHLAKKIELQNGLHTIYTGGEAANKIGGKIGPDSTKTVGQGTKPSLPPVNDRYSMSLLKE